MQYALFVQCLPNPSHACTEHPNPAPQVDDTISTNKLKCTEFPYQLTIRVLELNCAIFCDCVVCYMETAEYVGFWTVDWVHTDAAAATDLFGSVSKAALRSLCLCLIIFYHASTW